MNRLWNSAIGLLIVTGGLLGLILPFRQDRHGCRRTGNRLGLS